MQLFQSVNEIMYAKWLAYSQHQINMKEDSQLEADTPIARVTGCFDLLEIVMGSPPMQPETVGQPRTAHQAGPILTVPGSSGRFFSGPCQWATES